MQYTQNIQRKSDIEQHYRANFKACHKINNFLYKRPERKYLRLCAPYTTL